MASVGCRMAERLAQMLELPPELRRYFITTKAWPGGSAWIPVLVGLFSVSTRHYSL